MFFSDIQLVVSIPVLDLKPERYGGRQDVSTLLTEMGSQIFKPEAAAEAKISAAERQFM